MSISHASRITGSVFGAALGDALARPTEFMSFDEIRRSGAGIDLPVDGMVTDDTEMMIATGNALRALGSLPPGHRHEAERSLISAYLDWLELPKAGRAAGNGCMSALSYIRTGTDWPEATDYRNKGCGANMRVQPFGWLARTHGLHGHDVAGMAQLSAAITHAHPTALAAADLTQYAIHLAMLGYAPRDLPTLLLDYCRSERSVYRERWLGSLYATPTLRSHPRAIIAYGWDECARAIRKVRDSPRDLPSDIDPCMITGAGWVAEETLATALYCVMLHPTDPLAALRRAAVTSGDSDSIACVAGSISGALCGNIWPDEWMSRIEYADELYTLAHWAIERS